MFGEIREFVSLWNLSGPDCFAQNDLHQVIRYSVADGESLSKSRKVILRISETLTVLANQQDWLEILQLQ